MPLLPNKNPDVPRWKRLTFVLAIAAGSMQLVQQLAAVWEWSPTVVNIVMTVLALLLAGWQSLAVDDRDDKSKPPTLPTAKLLVLPLVLLVLAGCATSRPSPDTLPPYRPLVADQACTVHVVTDRNSVAVDLVQAGDIAVREVAGLINESVGGISPVLLSLATAGAHWATVEGLCRAFEEVSRAMGEGAVRVVVTR